MPKFFIALFALVFGSSAAQAVPISWTDWTAVTSSTTVVGTLDAGGSSVGVTYSGALSFAQVTGGGTYYWTEGSPAPYTGNSVVDNAPASTDIIALAAPGAKTITFDVPVLNPIFAMTSWNSQTVDFGTTIEILGYGAGYWGFGTPVLNGTGTGFSSTGEFHGVIRLPGVFTSITMTESFFENWHGFTIGVEGLGVPAPGAVFVLGLGLVGLGAMRRRV